MPDRDVRQASTGTPQSGGLSEASLLSCVQAAVAAPSLHNSQPWRFRIRNGGVDVYADRTRQLEVIDPSGRELLISVGAAVFNLRVAIRQQGWVPGGVDRLDAADTRATRRGTAPGVRAVGRAGDSATARLRADPTAAAAARRTIRAVPDHPCAVYQRGHPRPVGAGWAGAAKGATARDRPRPGRDPHEPAPGDPRAAGAGHRHPYRPVGPGHPAGGLRSGHRSNAPPAAERGTDRATVTPNAHRWYSLAFGGHVSPTRPARP